MKLTSALLGILAGACACLGQTNTASISGIVTGPEGATVPEAVVTATNDATAVQYTASSSDAGLYSIPNLPVGQYSLRVEHAGFKAYSRTGISLHTSEVLEVNVTLPIGAVTEKITVTAATPLLETRTSGLAQNLENKSIENLPLGNRRTMNIVELMPAAHFISDSPSGQPQYTLAGGRTQTQMVWIDGSNGQNIRIGAGQQNVETPVDTIQDIQVLSTNYSAEYGAANGGVVVQTTKSGTNQFHGSAYEFMRNDDFDAPGLFAPVQNGKKVSPELRYNLFGGTFGGPIRHDKTFFFVAYEGGRQRTGAETTMTVPSVLQRAGDFSQTYNAQGALVPIYDPATTQIVNGAARRTPFPGNIIPAGSLDPIARNLMNYYPLPNQAATNAAGANNFSGNEISSLTSDFVMVKVDHDLSSRDRLTGRYIFYRGPHDIASSVYPDPGADNHLAGANHSTLGYASWTHIIGPTKLNDFRLSYTNRVATTASVSVGQGYPAKLGITGVPGDAFPYIAPAGFSVLGSNAQDRVQEPVAQNQVVDNFSWVSGRHVLKFGGEVRQSIDDDLNLQTAAGAFTFATQATGLPGNSATGNGLASLLVGFPTGFTAQQVDKIYRRSWYYGAFAQDDWTVTPSLTINLGLRWEVDSPMTDLRNRLNGFDANEINPVSGTPGVVKFAGVNGYPRTPYNWDLNNFGPRFGFAWKPFNSAKTVVRGSFGIFFGLPYDGPVPIVALGFQTAATLNSPDNGITAPFYLRDGVPVSPVAPTLNDAYGAVAPGQNPNTTVTFFNRDRQTGYSQQFNFDIQRELPDSSRIDLMVLGNLGRHLPNTTLSMNQIPPDVLGPGHSSQAYRPFPQFSDVQMVDPTIGVSNYYAGVLRYEKRYTKGFNLVASYTWSKWLGNTFDNWNGAAAPYSNYYYRGADYGPTQYDIEQIVKFAPLYELPFGPGKRWLAKGVLGKVIGGWMVGNVTTIESGMPLTITANTNSTNAFSSGPLRPNVSGDPNISGGGTLGHWFNTSVFSQPAAYQFGNAGVGIVRAPGLFNMDFSLIRQFRLKESVQMQLRLETFNALNHPNLNPPGTVFGSAAFGTITSEVQARQMQIGARITF